MREEEFNTAESQFRSGEFRKALQGYLSNVEKYPSDALLFQRIAECYFQLHDYDDARVFAQKAAELDINLAIPHVTLAYSAYKKGNVSESKVEAEKAYGLSPDSSEVLDCYGTILLATGDHENAIKMLNNALSINSSSYSARNNIAIAYLMKKDYKRHLEETRKIYLQKPSIKNALRLLTAYQQRFALPLTAITIIALVFAIFYKIDILLLIPGYVFMKGIWNSVQFVKSGQWRKALTHFIVYLIFGLLIYLVYSK